MTNKFKVGDYVRCIKGYNSLFPNTIHKIKAISEYKEELDPEYDFLLLCKRLFITISKLEI